jgi:hypothetical protein
VRHEALIHHVGRETHPEPWQRFREVEGRLGTDTGAGPESSPDKVADRRNYQTPLPRERDGEVQRK